MAQSNMPRSTGTHGFCSAIFSSSPFTSDKENKSPNKPTNYCNIDTCDVTNKSSPIKRNNSKNGSCLPLDKAKTSSAPNLSPSATMMQKNNQRFKKVLSEEKLKTPVKNESRTTPFCAPKQVHNSKSVSKTPMKRYFNEHALSQTPDYFNVVQMETPKTKENGIEEQTIYEGESSNLTVGVRVRPLNFKELSEPKVSSVVTVDGQNIIVDCEVMQHTFTYDHCFTSHVDLSASDHANQETVFKNMVLPLVRNAFEGYNVCLFAYGQTGSGKSHSMMGPDSSQFTNGTLNPEAGIIPRFCYELFSRIKQNRHINTTVEISYFEIYNEKIHDLLISNNNNNLNNKKAPLRVREHPILGPYIVDLSQHVVQAYDDLKTWLKVGNSQRATAATGMNEKSSRSHSIFSIILTQSENEKLANGKAKDASRRSKINLVDLAGSERLSHTGVSGDRLRQGVSINKSLLTLGKVIASLAENTNNRKRGFVPYRESVLTWLLKESLGGNSRTAMLATVSPANIHVEETLATLRYACQARAIVNRVHVNEDQHDRLIRSLKAQVSRLEELKDGYERQLGLVPRRLLDSLESAADPTKEVQNKQREIDSLKEQLKNMEEQLLVSQKSWSQKLREAEEKKNSELKYLRHCGIAIELDLRQQSQPCLVNLSVDPMLSGTLLYLIPSGTIRIGKKLEGSSTPSKQPDIVLDGPLVKPLHCIIENKNGSLYLNPEPDGETFVNGKKVYRRLQLHHGDRLIIGGSHYFKVIHPQKKDVTQDLTETIDFEFAHQEVLREQEKELRAELEESKQKAMKELENAKREMETQFLSQKSEYESEIKILGSTLEQQKLALEDINRKQKQVEWEKELLVREVETKKRIMEMQLTNTDVQISPYESNFLEELKKILNETTADTEVALTIRNSNDVIKAGGVSLYEIQLLVQEATARCREVGLNYEFHQQQIVVDKKLQPVIRVRDKDHMMESLWQPTRFLDWVHRLRDHEIENSIKELRDSEDDWEPYEKNDTEQDSLECSRISVNITPVKKQLNESIFQMSLDSSILDLSLSDIDRTSESVAARRQEDMNHCLIQMEIAAKTLSKLCQQYQTHEISGKVATTLDKVYDSINDVKVILSTAENDSNNFHMSSNINKTVTESLTDTKLKIAKKRYFAEDSKDTEQKYKGTEKDTNKDKSSNNIVANGKKYFEQIESKTKKLNTGCPFSKNSNGTKSVRFDIN